MDSLISKISKKTDSCDKDILASHASVVSEQRKRGPAGKWQMIAVPKN